MTLTNHPSNALTLESGRFKEKGITFPEHLWEAIGIFQPKNRFCIALNSEINFSYTEPILIHLKIRDTSVYTQGFKRNFMTFHNMK